LNLSQRLPPVGIFSLYLLAHGRYYLEHFVLGSPQPVFGITPLLLAGRSFEEQCVAPT